MAPSDSDVRKTSYVMFAAKTEVLIKTGSENVWLIATP